MGRTLKLPFVVWGSELGNEKEHGHYYPYESEGRYIEATIGGPFLYSLPTTSRLSPFGRFSAGM